jgi:hypothetical protein
MDRQRSFDDRLRLLAMLIGSDQTIELFNQEYESLYYDIAGLSDSPYDFVFRLRRLGYGQAEYLMRPREKAGKHEEGKA